MSKTLSYRGKIDMGTENRIKLATKQGKVGYKINKFQIISTTPGTGNVELVSKITKVTDTNIGPTAKFTDADLLGVAFYSGNENAAYPFSETIIFDNEMVNQDIFVSMADADGGTVPGNYYIELETMNLSDVEATMLTLESIKTIIGQ